jgi:hypothetical protein
MFTKNSPPEVHKTIQPPECTPIARSRIQSGSKQPCCWETSQIGFQFVFISDKLLIRRAPLSQRRGGRGDETQTLCGAGFLRGIKRIPPIKIVDRNPSTFKFNQPLQFWAPLSPGEGAGVRPFTTQLTPPPLPAERGAGG